MPTILSKKAGGSGGGGAPSGPAGGDLSGTYPNPDLAAGSVGRSELATGIGAYDLLFDSLLGADANFDITGIPGTYKHLLLIGQVRGADAGAGVTNIRFNNDSGANYDYQFIQAQGQSGGGDLNPVNNSAVAQTSSIFAALTNSGHAAGLACAFVGEIPNYAGTAFHKSFTSRDQISVGTNTTSQLAHWLSGRWRNTAAITRITVFANTGNMLAGSRLTLYGLG